MSTGMQVRWVTFDCFGTLVDWQAGLTAVLAPLAGDRASDIARTYPECLQRVEGLRPHRSHKQVLAAALVCAAWERGLRLSDSDAGRLPGSWASLRPFADSEAMLAELRRMGYRLAVLTNCDDDLFEITHRAFRQPFDLFVTGERVRAYKPAPWHFRAFERLTGVRRRDWVHVSSSRYHDIEPAEALGVKRVWLDREPPAGVSSTGSARVHSALEAVGAIEGLFSRN